MATEIDNANAINDTLAKCFDRKKKTAGIADNILTDNFNLEISGLQRTLHHLHVTLRRREILEAYAIVGGSDEECTTWHCFT